MEVNMKFKERLDKFLQLQSKNMNFEDISKELKISQSTLRSFLNKRGYKYDSGKYILKVADAPNVDISQIKFVDTEKKSESKKLKPSTHSKSKDKLNNIKESKMNKTTKQKSVENDIVSNVKKKQDNKDTIKDKDKDKIKIKPKKDRKINITQDDLDKLCEVYDWYLEVKDNKSIKSKNIKSNKKDIKIENTEIKNVKTASIKVDKNVWQDFERLCSNSKYSKQEIITQALLDFMKEYKNLL